MHLGLGLFLQALVRSGFMANIIAGSGAPGAGTGLDGDYYYDTANPLNFYGPKAAGAWPAAINLLSGTAGQILKIAEVTNKPAFLRPREWVAADNGWLAESMPLALMPNFNLMGTAGTIQFAKVQVPEACSVTGIGIYIDGAGATLTSGQCLAALYQNNNLVGVTADQSAVWNTTGMKKMALVSGPFAIAAGTADIAYFWNGTTAPTILRTQGFAAGADSFNQGLSGTGLRAGSADAGRTTTMPATLGARSSGTFATWAAIY